MKELNTIQTRFALIRANGVDEEKRTAIFEISNELVDSFGTVFLSDGWDFNRYNNNPVVFFQHGSHSSDPDMLIGTSRIFQEDKKTFSEVTFEPAEDNPLAEKVFRKVKNGTLRGASVGVDIKEGRWGVKDAGENPDVIYFTKKELLEWSIVTIPSNPETLKRNAQSIEDLKKKITPVVIQEADPEKRTLSRFGAQVIINQNSQLR